MPGRVTIKEPLEHLGSEGCSVLAVLVLAAEWPERFPGGWVSVSEFGRYGLYLGERASRESLKAAIRRGLRQVGSSPDAAHIEVRRTPRHEQATGRPLRERDRRLAAQPGLELQRWLLREGRGLIAPSAWRRSPFAAVHEPAHPAATPHALMRRALEEVDTCLRAQGVEFARGGTERRALLKIRRALREGLQRAGDRGR
jgi:hypothetical protein